VEGLFLFMNTRQDRMSQFLALGFCFTIALVHLFFFCFGFSVHGSASPPHRGRGGEDNAKTPEIRAHANQFVSRLTLRQISHSSIGCVIQRRPSRLHLGGEVRGRLSWFSSTVFFHDLHFFNATFSLSSSFLLVSVLVSFRTQATLGRFKRSCERVFRCLWSWYHWGRNQFYWRD
jgi:hypothetical protein